MKQCRVWKSCEPMGTDRRSADTYPYKAAYCAIIAFLLRPPGPAWNCTSLVCERCGAVEAVNGPSLDPTVTNCVSVSGFAPASKTLEIPGTCST